MKDIRLALVQLVHRHDLAPAQIVARAAILEVYVMGTMTAAADTEQQRSPVKPPSFLRTRSRRRPIKRARPRASADAAEQTQQTDGA